MKFKNIFQKIFFILGSIGSLFLGVNIKPSTRKKVVSRIPKYKLTANEALRSDWQKLCKDANIAVNKVKQKYKI